MIPAEKYYTTVMKAPDKQIPVPPLLDFRKPKIIRDVCLDPTLPSDTGGGIDFIYVTNGKSTVLENEKYRLEIQTDMPTIAVYTNNYPREGQLLSNGRIEEKYSAIALECEEIPNDFDAIAVIPGQIKKRHIYYVFSKKK
jgi:galactose mutarotase-like enzyme